MEHDEIEYCKCEKSSCFSAGTNDEGFWYICCDCDKVIEDSFEYHEGVCPSDF